MISESALPRSLQEGTVERNFRREQGLVERQQTAVDSNVFPLILQSHFEDRLSWANSVPKLKCTKVPLDKRRPDAPEEEFEPSHIN